MTAPALLWLASCNEPPPPKPDVVPAAPSISDTTTEQISQYVRCVFQDRDGNMWFGTTSDGVARYDGHALDYFNATNEFGSDWVNAIVQSENGDLWFGTRDGVVRYDGMRFTRYTAKHGLVNDHIWCLLLDKSGVLWCGTMEGVSRFDDGIFSSFLIPPADLSGHPYYQDPKKINAILQDRGGSIWFATNGGGVYRYDGKSLSNLSTKQGLCDDFVQVMLEDQEGKLWFGTRFGGACTYDGSTFNSFKGKDLKGENVGVLYQEKNGTLWLGEHAIGLCSSYNSTLTCYDEQDGAGVRVIISVLEDANGQLWLGTGNGLYRFNGGKFTNVTKEILRQQ